MRRLNDEAFRVHMGLLGFLYQDRRMTAQSVRFGEPCPGYRKNVVLIICNDEDFFPVPDGEGVPHGNAGRFLKRGHLAHRRLPDLLGELLEDFLAHALDELDGAHDEVAAAVHAAALDLIS